MPINRKKKENRFIVTKSYRPIYLALLVATALMAAILLTGCGPKEDPTVTAAPPPGPNATAVEPVKNKNMPMMPAPAGATAPETVK